MLLDTLWFVFWFIVTIGVLVTVHEFGHFWVARRLGVQVILFSIGFGRPLWRYVSRTDATEYRIAAIPLGGYVKMLDETEGPVAPQQRQHAFNLQPLWIRFAIVAAGPAFNFLFAVFAYWLMFMLGVSGYRPVIGEVHPESIAQQAGIVSGDEIIRIGEHRTRSWQSVIQTFVAKTLDSEDVMIQVNRKPQGMRIFTIYTDQINLDDLTGGQFFYVIGMVPERPKIKPLIDAVRGGSPAAQAGLLPGDVLEFVDDKPITDWTQWRRYIRQHPEQPIIVDVRRGTELMRLQLTPDLVVEGGENIGRIGVTVAIPDRASMDDHLRVIERYGPLAGLLLAMEKTATITGMTLQLLWKMVTLELSVRNLSGPISIAHYAGLSAEGGIAKFLQFIAIVSISLGILNLLPVPLLDGGHLLYYCIESVTGRPVSEYVQYLGQRLGIAFLVGLMGLAFYNDAVRLFN